MLLVYTFDMPLSLKERLYALLRASERYTKTDMLYLAKSGWWLTAGTITLSLCSLVLYVLFANLLTKQEFGTYQYLIAAGGLLASLTLTGMNSATARAVAQGFEGTLKRAVSLQLYWGIVPLTAGLLTAGYYYVQGNSLLSLGFLLLAVFTPLHTAFNTYGAYFQGKGDFRSSFWYGLIWHLPLYSALALTAILSGEALVLLLVNLLVQTVATALLYFIALRKTTNDTQDQKALTYGFHLSGMNLPSMIAAQIDAILIFQLLGAVPLALYTFATVIPNRLTGFFKFLPTAALPRLSEKTPAEVRAALRPSRLIFIAVAALVGTWAYALVSPYVFGVLFPAYTDAVMYSQWYALIFLAVIGNLFVTGLTANRDLKDLYVYNIAAPLIQIALLVIGILTYGLWGLIVGRLIASGLSIILAYFLLFRQKTESSLPVTND